LIRHEFRSNTNHLILNNQNNNLLLYFIRTCIYSL